MHFLLARVIFSVSWSAHPLHQSPIREREGEIKRERERGRDKERERERER